MVDIVPNVEEPRWFRSLFGALFLINLVPIWAFQYFPSQDGPSHLYNAQLLLGLLDPANFQIRQFYEYNPGLHPNLLASVFLAVTQLWVPPLLAEKLLLTLIVAGLPLSLAYLTRAFSGRVTVLSLIGFLFAYHNLLHMGFYAFSLGLPLSLFTLGFWWSCRDRMTLARIAMLNLLIGLTFFAHFLPFVMALFATTVSVGWCAVFRASRSGLRVALSGAAVHLGYLLPWFALAFDFALRTRTPDQFIFQGLSSLEAILRDNLVLASYTDWHLHLAPIVQGLLGAATILTLARRVRARVGLEERDVLFLLAALLLMLFFRMPFEMNKAGWINERLFLHAVLLAFAWIGILPHRFRLVFAGVLATLAIAHTGRLAWEYAQLQPEIREYTAATHLVAPHSTLALDYADDGSEEFAAGIRYVHPFRLLHSYYGLYARDVVLFNNYQILFPYFAVRRGAAPRNNPDYVVAWRHRPGSKALQRYTALYEIAHQSEHLVLLRRRTKGSGDANGASATNGALRIVMWRVGLHKPGTHGWVRTMPKRRFRRADSGEAIGDARDRTFRIDLPNGRYRVMLRFPPLANDAYVVDVLAGDAHTLRGHRVTSEGSGREAAFEVDVEGSALTLVFHAVRGLLPSRGRLPVWALSEMSVELVGP